jgi:uncharacterized protein
MQLENRFEVPLPAPAAWSFLMDVASTVQCFPGAQLLGQVDEDRYKGYVTLKLGPFTMVFLGDVRLERHDPITRSGMVTATWSETRGLGGAMTVTRFSMQDRGDVTAVWLHTDVQLASDVARYGLGARMVSEISRQLVACFAENVRARIRHASQPFWNAEHAPRYPLQPAAHISAAEVLCGVVSARLKGLFS